MRRVPTLTAKQLIAALERQDSLLSVNAAVMQYSLIQTDKKLWCRFIQATSSGQQ